MCVCFWAYLTAVSDTPHLQAESASTQEKDLHVYKNNNAKSPFESSSQGSTGRAGAVLLSPAHPAMPGWCIIPFAHGENKGVGVYFLRDLYSWQLFWGRKEKRSIQANEIMYPLPFPNASQRLYSGLAVSLWKWSIWTSLEVDGVLLNSPSFTLDVSDQRERKHAVAMRYLGD